MRFRLTILAGLLFLGGLLAQPIPVRQLAATCLTGGSAAQPDTRSFGDTTGLELHSEFSRRQTTRAIWDFGLKRDLRQTAAIRMRYRCPDSSGASQFNLYIKAEQSWYSAVFSPQADGNWHELIIPKTLFIPETEPASWQNCSTLRLAIWRSQPRDVIFQIAAIELVNPNVNVAIVRNWNTAKDGRESYTYASHLGNCLQLGGIFPAVIEDADSSAQIFLPYQLLLLPYPSGASSHQLEAVQNYIRQGGHAGLFHSLPPPLAARMNFPLGKFTRSAELKSQPVSVVPNSHLLPEGEKFRQQSSAFLAVRPVPPTLRVTAWWHDSEGKSIGYPAIVENSTGFWMTHVFLNQDPLPASRTLLAQISRFAAEIPKTSASQLLSQARFDLANSPRNTSEQRANAGKFLQNAERLFQSGQYSAAADFARNSRKALTAVTPVNRSKTGEFRALWLRNPQGLPGQSWNSLAATLRRHGINAVFPKLGDATGLSPHLASCLDGCQASGLKVHLWLPCLSVEDLPADVRQSLSRQGLLQRDFKGHELPWLCPNQPANRQRLSKLAAEAAASQKLTGLHLDFLRFPSSQACTCPKCQAMFTSYLGHKPANWPSDIMPGHSEHEAWLSFRCQTISQLVKEISDSAHKVRPSLQVSAAVFPDADSAGRNVGQDWPQWLKSRYISFICPMSYYDSHTQAVSAFRRQAAETGNARLILPGIGVTNQRLDTAATLNQINALRNEGAPGFILFEGNAHLILDMLPGLELAR